MEVIGVIGYILLVIILVLINAFVIIYISLDREPWQIGLMSLVVLLSGIAIVINFLRVLCMILFLINLVAISLFCLFSIKDRKYCGIYYIENTQGNRLLFIKSEGLNLSAYIRDNKVNKKSYYTRVWGSECCSSYSHYSENYYDNYKIDYIGFNKIGTVRYIKEHKGENEDESIYRLIAIKTNKKCPKNPDKLNDEEIQEIFKQSQATMGNAKKEIMERPVNLTSNESDREKYVRLIIEREVLEKEINIQRINVDRMIKEHELKYGKIGEKLK